MAKSHEDEGSFLIVLHSTVRNNLTQALVWNVQRMTLELVGAHSLSLVLGYGVFLVIVSLNFASLAPVILSTCTPLRKNRNVGIA